MSLKRGALCVLLSVDIQHTHLVSVLIVLAPQRYTTTSVATELYDGSCQVHGENLLGKGE